MNTGRGAEKTMQSMGGMPQKRKTVCEPTYNPRPKKRSKQTASSPGSFDVRLSPAVVQADRSYRPTSHVANINSDLQATAHLSTLAGAHDFVFEGSVNQIFGDYIVMARPSSEAGPSNYQPMQGIVQGRRALDHEDLSIQQETYSGLGYRMHLGQIRQSGRVVSVKVYRGSYAKKRCSDTARFLIKRGVMHPNIPHLIAVSGLKSETPFLVFDGEYEDTVDSMLSWVLKKDTKEILTSGLQTVVGLSSGLDYLQELNYPFASVGLDHFVILSSKGKIVISFDPEELEPTSELDQELGLPNHIHTDTAQDFFHKLCQRTFNDACKVHYKSRHNQHTYHDEFDDDVDDLLENWFEEFADDSSSLAAPASSSATTTMPPPRSPQCPSGRRQELTWKPLEADTVTLKDISRQFQSFLNFHRSSSEPVLSRRRGRYRVRTSHRCPGYSRIEVTLTTDILRSAIVSHSSPTPGEICPVCGEVVKEEILSCLCGNFDDESMPTVRCSTCFEWHHRPCVGGFNTEKFVCKSCNQMMHKTPSFLDISAANPAQLAEIKRLFPGPQYPLYRLQEFGSRRPQTSPPGVTRQLDQMRMAQYSFRRPQTNPAVTRHWQLNQMRMAQNQQSQSGPVSVEKLQLSQMRQQQQQQQRNVQRSPSPSLPPPREYPALPTSQPSQPTAAPMMNTANQGNHVALDFAGLITYANDMRSQVAQYEAQTKLLLQQLSTARGTPAESQLEEDVSKLFDEYIQL
ncbi:hypothetical protein GALMADRAFT_242914 [Galerina marginata CBS 339.88]|uniref:Protein kinase domain-containing protein n=1 Tax=Galerina marginata (strain CBS 339.88) TaxID=685588 RepID=A0A067TDR7_GALM3|nr:hypothetical protein GALMADRAFT_242914 [Galerina marginata CBS 339.88]